MEVLKSSQMSSRFVTVSFISGMFVRSPLCSLFWNFHKHSSLLFIIVVTSATQPTKLVLASYIISVLAQAEISTQVSGWDFSFNVIQLHGRFQPRLKFHLLAKICVGEGRFCIWSAKKPSLASCPSPQVN